MKLAGAESVRKSLSRMSGCEKDVGTALVAGAQLVRNEARLRAPRVSGTLRKSIEVGNLQSFAGDVYVEVGTNLVYARRVEYGFNGADSLGRVYHQAAQPYLEPACEAKAREVGEEVEKAVRQLWAKA